MLRRPGRSKASADTLCQKCLKRGHYSYECTVSAQDRPYKPRPSRTQQLLNPQLKPKLNSEVPNDLLRKKDVADEILAKKEKERQRSPGRRSRSASYSSDSDSVSTISTNRSLSKPPSPRRIDDGRASLRGGDVLGKRSRRSVSTASDHSEDKADRNTRRRVSAFSPSERGRRRTRSRSSHMDISHDEDSQRRGTRKHRSRSHSFSRARGTRRLSSRDRDIYRRQPARRASPSRSPSRSPNYMDTSEDRHGIKSPGLRGKWGASTKVHRSPSPQPRPRSRNHPRGPSPYSRRRISRSPNPYQHQDGSRVRNGAYNGGYHQQFSNGNAKPAPTPQAAPLRERSLSPYSKRVAMTRAMQAGR